MVQETQFAAQTEILRGNTLVESVYMSWPNRHYFLVDFTRFPEVSGLKETAKGDVYRATGKNIFRIFIVHSGSFSDLPYGVIESTLHRDDL